MALAMTRRGHRWLARVFGFAAALLVPWIVVLASTQHPTGIAQHVRGLTVGLMAPGSGST